MLRISSNTFFRYFFKRISDLWDEEYQQALIDSGGDLTYAEFQEFIVSEYQMVVTGEDVRKITNNVGEALQKALHGIEEANFEMFHDVFGDAQWTNRNRMSDEKMLDLIEHFSQYKLTIAWVPHDITLNTADLACITRSSVSCSYCM